MNTLEAMKALYGYAAGMIRKLTRACDLVMVHGWDERNRAGRLCQRSGDRSRRITLICVVMVVVAAVTAHQVDAAGRTVKVGVYQNMPKIFMDANGHASGIYVDLLAEIAAEEGWTLVYVPCQWVDCLTALENGQIDLMPDVAYSTERALIYDFHHTAVLESWSQVYASPA